MPSPSHGGLRPGAGRRFGSKNRLPSKPLLPQTIEAELAWEKEQNQRARLEIGRLTAENDELREKLNYHVPFTGDSKALFAATMAGTYFPSAQQLYSADRLLPHQYPRPEPTQDESESGIFDRPEYLAAIATITKALIPYPEARRAVAEALRKLEKPRSTPLTIDARPVEA
jgi:hypothetical protein